MTRLAGPHSVLRVRIAGCGRRPDVSMRSLRAGVSEPVAVRCAARAFVSIGLFFSFHMEGYLFTAPRIPVYVAKGSGQAAGSRWGGRRSSSARVLSASRPCCLRVAKRLARTSSAWAPAGVRWPPQTLRLTTAGRRACSAPQFVVGKCCFCTNHESSGTSYGGSPLARWGVPSAGAIGPARFPCDPTLDRALGPVGPKRRPERGRPALRGRRDGASVRSPARRAPAAHRLQSAPLGPREADETEPFAWHALFAAD